MIAIALHGGCGVMSRSSLPDSEWEAARDDIATALRRGYDLLAHGGSAVDAVEACVVVLEDSPHFNAGHGAALNHAGEHELDASIMNGATGAAGAVCAARAIRNPVRAARALLDQAGPLLLAGPAADRFAAAAGLPLEPQTYFTTARRVAALKTLQSSGARNATESEKHGTVGAVALDSNGHLAAATSTGGYTDKPEGRVGDSPVIGAGTYAQDGVCAVSCTGQGEFFIRHAVAHEISARMRHLGESLDEAAHFLIDIELDRHKVGAGLIAMDHNGLIAAPFNTEGMFRGWIAAGGTLTVSTHRERT